MVRPRTKSRMAVRTFALVATLCTVAVARADDSACLEARLVIDRPTLRWSRTRYSIPAEFTGGQCIIADTDGDGRNEVLIAGGHGSLLQMKLGGNGEVVSQRLQAPAGVGLLPRLLPVRDPILHRDLLAWSDDRRMQSFVVQDSGSLSPVADMTRNLSGSRRLLRQQISAKVAGVGVVPFASYFYGADPRGAGCEYAEVYGYVGTERVYGALYCIHASQRFAGFADVDGDGTDEMLETNDDGARWTVVRVGNPEVPWAEFPSQGRWTRRVIGDFNGDGLADIVVYDAPFSGAWIAYSLGDYALERPFAWPFPAGARVAAGDVNGDGAYDLISLESNGDGLALDVAVNGAPELSDEVRRVVVKSGRGPDPAIGPAAPAVRAGELHAGSWSGCELAEGPVRVLLTGNGRPAAEHVVHLSADRSAVAAFLTGELSSGAAEIGRATGPGARDEPSVCLGYRPAVPTTTESKWGRAWGSCPRGYAFYGTAEGAHVDAARNVIWGACCKLPADDVLEDRTHEVEATQLCPPGYFVTGASRPGCASCGADLLCTAVNATRYELGPPLPGRYWGEGFSGRQQRERLQLTDLPLAVRYGVARSGYSTWDIDGCVGTPAGAVLVGAVGRYCDQTMFSELRFRGLAGDPPAGTPVTMFPRCRELQNPFDPASGCIPDAPPP